MSKPTLNGGAASPLEGATAKRRTATQAATILMTGMGGIVGQGILKCLTNSPYRMIGVDASELAAGLYVMERGYVVPRVNDPSYIDHLLGLCLREGVRYVFPGLDMELPVLAQAAPRLREQGVLPIVSSPEVIELADDKLATARFLQAHGFEAPKTVDLGEESPRKLGFPVVLKPRRGGSRSQGVFIIPSESELDYRLATINVRNYVAQEYLDGDEFSAGTVTFDGRCRGTMVMRRTLRDGDTHKAFVFRNPEVEAYLTRVANALKPFGPCNFQFRMRRGLPAIFEINPRCSGGSCVRALAGFNEPLMIIDYLETGVEPAFEIRPISVFRYWKELVVENVRIQDARATGAVRNVGQKL